MKLPDFLFIGPDKSGSTWLYRLLLEHPQCYIPPAKDLYFFDRYYHKGLPWYSRFFKQAGKLGICSGEICHDYLYSTEAMKRIRRDLPDVKLITILREPVERSYSHYLYLKRSGLTNLSAMEAVQTLPQVVDHSCYFKFLSEYFKCFHERQILVMDFDSLKHDPQAFASQITTFLGISKCSTIPGKQRGASAARVPCLSKGIKRASLLARQLGFANILGRIKNGPIQALLYRPAEPVETAIPAEFSQQVRGMIQQDTEQLRQFLAAKRIHIQWLHHDR